MGEPTVVLVPGAGGAAWYWHRVVDRLAGRGHQAIAVDLPADDPAADLPDYVDAVVAAAAGCSDVVLVAQSLGGFTATAACARLPVSLLVFVNAMIPAIGETPGEWWAATGQREARAEMDARDGRPIDADFDVITYFLHDVPSEVLADPAAAGREQSGTPFSSVLPIDRWPDVRTKAIVGRDDRFFPAEFQRRVAKERLGTDVDVVPGGHLAALSQPDAIVGLLESYLAE
jgi:pimeloyl-ACP methyl ester carboxylesterase